MIPCPSCQQSVEIQDIHLGTLFTCPHCNAVYFIDWNGQPEIASHEAEAEQSNSYYEPPSADVEGDLPQSNTESFQPGVQPDFQAESFQEEEPSPQTAQEFQRTSMEEVAYDFSQPLEQESLVDSADFSDVTDYANSNSNLGPLSYTVTIEGLESSHLLIQLKEAMTDSRFGWETATLLTEVSGGRLVLSGLSPAKASVLISRIKYLPLKISWRQDVLYNT